MCWCQCPWGGAEARSSKLGPVSRQWRDKEGQGGGKDVSCVCVRWGAEEGVWGAMHSSGGCVAASAASAQGGPQGQQFNWLHGVSGEKRIKQGLNKGGRMSVPVIVTAGGRKKRNREAGGTECSSFCYGLGGASALLLASLTERERDASVSMTGLCSPAASTTTGRAFGWPQPA